MLKSIYKKLFMKKWELLILGTIVTIMTLGRNAIAIEHWVAIDFDLSSYSPLSPILGAVWSICGGLVLWIRKIKSPALWIIFIASGFYTIIMFWAMYLR